MKLLNRILAAVSIALGVYVAVSGKGMGLMSGSAPGPGFLPFCIGLLITFLGVLQLLTGFFKGTDNRPNPFKKEEFYYLGIVAGGSVGVIVLTPLLGLIPPLGLLTGFLARMLGEKHWPTLIAITVLTPVALYLIFSVGLGVPIPMGIFKR